MKIGIISAVCQKFGSVDHIDAIRLADKYGIKIVQLYLSSGDLQKSNDYFLEISEQASKFDVELITHINENLQEEYFNEIAEKHSMVLKNQANKISVIHFGDNLKEGILEAFIERGITVYVENYHRGILDPSELLKHDRFVEFVSVNSQRIGVVVDFARYFSGEDVENIDCIKGLIVSDLKKFKENDVSVMFHTIGRKSFISGRKNWAIPGSEKDLIPQKELLNQAMEIFDSGIGPVIIECEEKKEALKGVNNLKAIFGDK